MSLLVAPLLPAGLLPLASPLPTAIADQRVQTGATPTFTASATQVPPIYADGLIAPLISGSAYQVPALIADGMVEAVWV